MTQILSNKPQQMRRTPFGLKPWIPKDLMDFERIFDSMFENQQGFVSDAFATRLDVVETDNAVEIKMDLPGVKSDEIEINVENNLLTIRGERKEQKEETDKVKQFHRIERRFGSFSRSITLPTSVNDSEAAAEFKDGVLKIVLPKSEEAKPKKITIK